MTILNGAKYMSLIKDLKIELEEIDFSQKSQKKFGILFIFVFFVLSIWFFFAPNQTIFILFFSLTLFFIIITLLFKNFLFYLYYAWMLLSLFLAWFISRLITIIIFYLIVSPLGLGARLFGKKFLDTDKKESYWIPRKINSKNNYNKIY
jgi:hypothetical protein